MLPICSRHIVEGIRTAQSLSEEQQSYTVVTIKKWFDINTTLGAKLTWIMKHLSSKERGKAENLSVTDLP